MAKSEKKKDGKKKGARKAANPIPKEVGGIKVPKELRKAGKKAVELAKDPVVSEVVAAALLSAAAALRAPPSGAGKAKASAEGSQGTAKAANPIGDTLKVLAVDLARRTLEGVGDRQRKRGREPESQPPEGADV